MLQQYYIPYFFDNKPWLIYFYFERFAAADNRSSAVYNDLSLRFFFKEVSLHSVTNFVSTVCNQGQLFFSELPLLRLIIIEIQYIIFIGRFTLMFLPQGLGLVTILLKYLKDTLLRTSTLITRAASYKSMNRIIPNLHVLSFQLYPHFLYGIMCIRILGLRIAEN